MNRVGKQVTIPGILGGMGPLAHLEFERRLIQRNLERGASCDQDHPVWILIGASDIPDRTQSLAGLTEDCTPWLVRYGRILEQAGADFLVVTCNTSHAFYSRVQPQLQIPWLRLMDCTAEFIRTQYPQVKQVGILATDGTLQTGLYSQPLLNLGLTPILPVAFHQAQVMQSIYHPNWGIKASGTWVSDQAMAQLRQAITTLQHQGAELVIAGCTELSVGLARMPDLPMPWVDPLDVMAGLSLDLAFGHRPVHSMLAA
ncbi:aspartate/glutamate racemase family protein [Rivularia sp. UHCC 0363]|uniref:aspartate/glutamate racemase family protein n=1 Tax=Rivularia sp. UHCC 0363 TaxID=3110244 RepID=UPI002B20810A|nr:amino acid racemase [Rivularia sp. UHCC 0363]MEA5597362.1 amino acid racemase [Rivularia sp. UHCC 0363]